MAWCCGTSYTREARSQWSALVGQEGGIPTFRGRLVARPEKLTEVIGSWPKLGSPHGNVKVNFETRYILMTTFCFGAYGTNNVGDEAIFEGLRSLHKCVVPIYVNKARVAPSVWYADLLEGRCSFPTGAKLILGGGGIMFSREAVLDMISLAKLARSAGCIVEMARVGFEAAQENYFGDIQDLLGLCSRVTVRSTVSQQILQKICGVQVVVERDFAYELRNVVDSTPAPPRADMPTVGVVLSGDVFGSRYTAISRTIEQFTVGENRTLFRHIPHSRAYVDPRNNDCIVGQYLWSSISVYHAAREDRFVLEDFTNDPNVVLTTYKKLDGVISERFHGLIFADILGLPLLALSGGLKNESFVRDYSGGGLFVSRSDDDFDASFGTFWAMVYGRWSSRASRR